MGIEELVDSLGIKKSDGISVFQSVLTLIFLSVIWQKADKQGRDIERLRYRCHRWTLKNSIKKVYLHEFLDQITVSCAEKFQNSFCKIIQ